MRGELPVQDIMPLVESGIKLKGRRPKKMQMKLVGGLVCILALLLFPTQTFYKGVNMIASQRTTPLFGKSGVYKVKTWVSKQTVSKLVAAETNFARCDIHTVRLEDGTLIDDWVFLEERSAINVIVINKDGLFVVFQQEKYAIEGQTLSPVGGFIDDGETPLKAAQREVKEELGLGSNNITSPDPDWIQLGSYRTAANRGGGFSYFFLLKNAIPILPNGGTKEFKGSGDNEAQNILFLTKDQILDAVSKAQFQEVKWTAALSLALLHMDGKVGQIRNVPL